jgi:hypothetical protein
VNSERFDESEWNGSAATFARPCANSGAKSAMRAPNFAMPDPNFATPYAKVAALSEPVYTA